MAIPITWQLQVVGAENVKSRLADINGQFERGEITAEQYASGLRSVNRDARVLSNTMTIQKNIFLATHPTLNNLSRAMSIFGSVNRAVMNGLNTINIAMIALNTNTSGMAQAVADVAQAQREYDDAVLRFGPDSKQAIEALDNLRVAQARLAEETQSRANQITNSWFAVGTAISGIVTSIVLTLPKILPFLSAVGLGMVGVAAGFVAALAFVVFQFLDFLKIEPFVTWSNQLNDIFRNTFGFEIPNLIDISARALADFFVKMLPSYFASGIEQLLAFSITFQIGWIRFWNGVITILEQAANLIIKSIVGFLNGVVRLANEVIRGLNNIPGVSIPLIAPVTFKPVEFGKLDEGGFTNESASGIIPGSGLRPGISGKGAETAAANNIVINVQGSLLTENDLTKIFDKWLKDQLLGQGF